jgi:hypothetical protein
MQDVLSVIIAHFMDKRKVTVPLDGNKLRENAVGCYVSNRIFSQFIAIST